MTDPNMEHDAVPGPTDVAGLDLSLDVTSFEGGIEQPTAGWPPRSWMLCDGPTMVFCPSYRCY